LKDLLEHTDKNLKPDDEIPSLEMKCGMFFLFIILCTANPGVNTCEERQVLVAFASFAECNDQALELSRRYVVSHNVGRMTAFRCGPPAEPPTRS
jgi:hypothetical protein